MPNNWLNVPHFQQEFEYSCVAACTRMVLAYFGDTQTEAELRELLDTQPTGTRAGSIMRVSNPTFQVYLRSSNTAELRKVLDENHPPILFLQTGSLEYWNMDIFHVAVLVSIDDSNVALNDPYFAMAPQTTSLQTFEKAWSHTGQFTAFIQPRS